VLYPLIQIHPFQYRSRQSYHRNFHPILAVFALDIIDPTVDNGLSKSSSVDTLQLRGVDTQRFIKKLGVLSPSEIASITIAIVTVIEAEI
jgi:hypothetical protein